MHLYRCLLLCLVLATPAAGADVPHGNAALEKQLLAGSLRLKKSMFGRGVAGGAALKELYDQERWPDLVEKVVEKQFVSDLYYFYLGRSAEELGGPDVAIIYYKLAIEHSAKGDRCSFGFDSCRGLPMPQSAQLRIDRIADQPRPIERHITVLDSSRKPIANADVVLSSSPEDVNSCSVDTSGSCKIVYSARPSSTAAVRVSAAGMLPAAFTWENRLTADSRDVTLTGPQDYLCDELKRSGNDPLSTQLSAWALRIMSRAKVQGASLNRGSICRNEFKRKRYAALSLTHDSTYNEIRLNDYAIGVRVFDEVIRKLLDPMAAAVTELAVDGYDISVLVKRENFVDKTRPATFMSYRFYLPRATVQSYKDKDITGQQLIDASVILRDEERIDLRLQ